MRLTTRFSRSIRSIFIRFREYDKSRIRLYPEAKIGKHFFPDKRAATQFRDSVVISRSDNAHDKSGKTGGSHSEWSKQRGGGIHTDTSACSVQRAQRLARTFRYRRNSSSRYFGSGQI